MIQNDITKHGWETQLAGGIGSWLFTKCNVVWGQQIQSIVREGLESV